MILCSRPECQTTAGCKCQPLVPNPPMQGESEAGKILGEAIVKAHKEALVAAEARGYERGMEEAAAVAETYKLKGVDIYPNEIAAAIRSLKP